MLVASNDDRTGLSEDLVVESVVEKSNHVGGKASECNARSEVRGDGGLPSRKGRENEAAHRVKVGIKHDGSLAIVSFGRITTGS